MLHTVWGPPGEPWQQQQQMGLGGRTFFRRIALGGREGKRCLERSSLGECRPLLCFLTELLGFLRVHSFGRFFFRPSRVSSDPGESRPLLPRVGCLRAREVCAAQATAAPFWVAAMRFERLLIRIRMAHAWTRFPVFPSPSLLRMVRGCTDGNNNVQRCERTSNYNHRFCVISLTYGCGGFYRHSVY